MDVTALLATLFDLALVILGFGLIIFVHELGHFLAARWAGIRVLAFAIGLGSPIVSYRKGLGLRRGSSEPEITHLQQIAASGAAEDQEQARARLASLSPTEYRLTWLPFGGYVKMLGQEDANPTAVSDAPDSYQRCPVWKRMIVISAGVVMNVITAALLFVFVFMFGLRTEPAAIGHVAAGLPASRVLPINAGDLGVTDPGLKPGDRVVAVNGRRPNSFNDVVLASLMARRNGVVRLDVERAGFKEPLQFEIRPETSRISGLMEIGIEPPRSTKIGDPKSAGARQEFEESLTRIGLVGVKPGMRLVRVGDVQSPVSPFVILDAMRSSAGVPVRMEFATDDGRRVSVEVQPEPELQVHIVDLTDGSRATVEHLLGLTPVLMVARADDRGYRQGLRTGDIIARVGAVEYPSVPGGIEQIRASKGRRIEMTVIRQIDGSSEAVDLRPSVSSKSIIGFSAGDTARENTLLAIPPTALTPVRDGGGTIRPPAAELIDRPGLRLVRVGDREVSNLHDVRAALVEATHSAAALGEGAVVPVAAALPIESAEPIVQRREWSLSSEDVQTLHALSWRTPFSLGIFEPEETLLRAGGPIGAVGMGVAETHRVMMLTYLTLARLFEGTVRVEHLKGPVGIAHLGTKIADRGLIWLLFFMGLISVNLAVINFLPLPIVDGGQFLFLLAEQIRGKPVPPAVQNVATFVGLILIAAVFLIVTFNDVVNLFTG